jgi:hypothetical protein
MSSGCEGESVFSSGVDMDDLRRSEKEASTNLLARQYDFACQLDIDPELLRGLRYCHECHGKDYKWH